VLLSRVEPGLRLYLCQREDACSPAPRRCAPQGRLRRSGSGNARNRDKTRPATASTAEGIPTPSPRPVPPQPERPNPGEHSATSPQRRKPPRPTQLHLPKTPAAQPPQN
jgi:hypothetical protein